MLHNDVLLPEVLVIVEEICRCRRIMRLSCKWMQASLDATCTHLTLASPDIPPPLDEEMLGMVSRMPCLTAMVVTT